MLSARPQRRSRLTCCLALGAALLISTAAQADLYILGGESSESNVGSATSPVSWKDTSKWTPAAVPGSSDSFNWAPTKTGSHRQAYVALDSDYEIGYLTTSYRTVHLYKTGDAESVTFTVKNQLGGDGYQKCHTVNAGVKLVMPASATFICSKGDHTATGVSVLTNGEADIYAATQSRVMTLEVNGGTLVFAPQSYIITSWGRTETDHDEINVTSGTANFPSGITMTGSYSVPNQVNQTGGEVNFGGDFTSEMAWTYTWSGGTLGITDDCAFGSNISLVVPASSTVTLDVASGKTFTAGTLTADSTATITKTGAGTFGFSATPGCAVAVSTGGVALASVAGYNLSTVTFASGTTVALSALGATINSFNSTLTENVTFSADISSATAGTVILNSTSDDLLNAVKDDLTAPDGLQLSVSGGALSVENAASEYAFGGSGDILVGTGWGGSVPAAGVEVAITGATTVAMFSSGTFPAWTSIEVKDGATLQISADADLPPIVLNKRAKLEITTGTTYLTNGLACTATAALLPDLVVASGATLSVLGGMKFYNVNIDLKGTNLVTTLGGVTYGYAESGDTTYIGFSADGGIISLHDEGWSYDTAPFEVCCPAAGGTVTPVDDIVFKDSTILPLSKRDSTTYPFTESYRCAFKLGVNNPSTTPFEVVFDNTRWGVCGKTYIQGGATFRLKNGGSYINAEVHDLHGRMANIIENGRVIVGSGCEFRINAMGDYGDNPLNVNPSTSGYEAIVVEEGGVFECYRSAGNDNGVLSTSNSTYQVYIPWVTNTSFEVASTNTPFGGLAAVFVATNSTLTFSTRNRVFWDAGQFHDKSGERVVTLADVPMTGGGSVALSNANVNVFGVIVKNAANTATGTARVVAPGDGIGATTLWFADGANWAGKVVAGNVALTNLTDAIAAASVTFGGVSLAGDFPVRVWKTGAVVTTNDVVNLGTVDNKGGKIVPTLMSGDKFATGDKFTLGTIASGAELPALASGWRAKKVAVDENTCELLLRVGSGMQISVR